MSNRTSLQWLIGDTDRAIAELHRNRSQTIDSPMTFWIFAPDSTVAREEPEFHEWLDRPEQGALRRDLLAWLSKTVFPMRAPGLDVPELRNLYEFKTYLEKNMQTWPEQWEAKGLEKGIRQGREEGVRLGRKEGRKEGRREGEATVLLRQLGLKFGPPDEEVQERVGSADPERILGWAESSVRGLAIEVMVVSHRRRRSGRQPVARRKQARW